MIALRAGSATDVGLVRSNNQDQFLLADPLYAVADGMGGAAAGEVASAIAVEALANGFGHANGSPTADLLIQAAQAANRAVWDEAGANPEMRGMGTTLVAIALVEGPALAIVNIGDSRLYVLHDGELRQVTSDHNLVAEMVAEGRISKEEAEYHPRRNIMTRALGVEPEVPVDLFVEEPHVGDRYLLCSDGLPRELSDDLIASLLRRLADPDEAARELVEEAKRRGGNDNITVVVVDVVDAPDRPGAAEGAAAGALAGTIAAPTTADGPAGDAMTARGGDVTTTMAALAVDPSPRSDTAPRPDSTAPRTERAAAAAAPEAAAAGTTPSRRRLLRRPESPPARPVATRAPRAPLVTLRVVGFVVLLLAVLAAGAAGVVWYARSAYFVGLKGDSIVIFQGRPGGVLWFQPTLAATTGHTTGDVQSSVVPRLQAGQEEPSLAAARAYVDNAVAREQQAQAAQLAPTTTPTTPTTTPTTRPTTPTRARSATPTTAAGH